MLKSKLYKYLQFIFIFFFPSIVLASIFIEDDLSYVISYPANQNNCLAIKLDVKGNKEGKIILRTPPFATNFNFSTKGSLKYNNLSENVFEFILTPHDKLTADYQVCYNNTAMNIYKPIINADFIHFNPELILVTPESQLDLPRKISIAFSGFPNNFIFASNPAIDANKLTIHDSIKGFRPSIIVGANNTMKKFEVNGTPVHLLTKGNWAFFDKDASYYLEKIISTQREFWNDHDFPYYMIVLVQQQSPENKKLIMGTHYKNVLSMILPDSDKSKLPVALYSLSHELFHAWLGIKIAIPLPQGDLQWFFEGITDYYGLELLLKTGLIDNKDHLKIYNEHLKDYTLSPISLSSNEEIAKNYSTNKVIYAELATIRSHILFKELTHRLKTNNGMISPLDPALKEILASYSKKDAPQLTEAKVHEIFAKHVGQEDWLGIQSSLATGKLITHSPDLFKQDALLVNKMIKAPIFDFNVDNLVKLKQITSLDKNSKAYTAGLRENQKITDFSISFSNPKIPAKFLIADNGEEKVIKFNPSTNKKSVPQYQMPLSRKLSLMMGDITPQSKKRETLQSNS